MAIFRDDEDRHAYLQFIREESGLFDVEILAWCLMTNHVHFIAVPQKESSLAKAFGEAHRRYTRMRNFSEGVRGYLFQGRFGSSILDERHLLAAARYVEMNPVRAGMVKVAWEYSWSSARFHIGEQETDILVKDRTLQGLVSNWRELLTAESRESDERLRVASRTGRPTGNKGFIELIEQMTGRNLREGKPGRPVKQK